MKKNTTHASFIGIDHGSRGGFATYWARTQTGHLQSQKQWEWQNIRPQGLPGSGKTTFALPETLESDYSDVEMGILASLGVPEDMLQPLPDSHKTDLEIEVAAGELVEALELFPELLDEVRSVLNQDHKVRMRQRAKSMPFIQTDPPWGIPSNSNARWQQLIGRFKRNCDEHIRMAWLVDDGRERALELWEEYDKAVESYDFKVCTSEFPLTGSPMPSNRRERRLTSRNASQQWRLVRRKASGEGISESVLQAAKMSDARYRRRDQIIAELKEQRDERGRAGGRAHGADRGGRKSDCGPPDAPRGAKKRRRFPRR